MIYLYYTPKSICFKDIAYTFNKIIPNSKVVNEIVDTDELHIIWWPNVTKLPKNCIIYNMDPLVPHVMKELTTILKIILILMLNL